MPSGQPRRQQQRQGWLAADFSRMLVRRKPRPDGDCALSRSEVDQLLTRKDISLRERTLWRWALGYRWAPRLADLPDLRLWRIDRHAHYGPLDGLARNHINTPLIAEHWDEICRLTASLRAGTVVPSAILRTLQRGPAPSSLARALAELGRVIKTLHVLEYVHDPVYRRTIHHMLSRGERRNSLARDVFHGATRPAPQALPGRAGKPARQPRHHGQRHRPLADGLHPGRP